MNYVYSTFMVLSLIAFAICMMVGFLFENPVAALGCLGFAATGLVSASNIGN